MPKTQTISEMIAFMALSPNLKGLDKRRWDILYQLAFWALWKCHLSHSFGKPIKYWSPAPACGYYRMLVQRQILIDCILCIYERYRSKDYSFEVFERLWGKSPQMLKVQKGPKCLQGDPNTDNAYNKGIERIVEPNKTEGFNEMTQNELDEISERARPGTLGGIALR